MLRGSCLTLLGLAVCAGCGSGGPPLGKVSGAVTLDGKPLAGAGVIFNPTSNQTNEGPAYGQTDASGKYTLQYGSKRKGALPGPKDVTIEHNGHFYEHLSATVVLGDNTIDFRLPEDHVQSSRQRTAR